MNSLRVCNGRAFFSKRVKEGMDMTMTGSSELKSGTIHEAMAIGGD